MTVTMPMLRQREALDELHTAWRETQHNSYVAKPTASAEQAVGARAGYLAYCFAARVLEAGGSPSDITARLDDEADRARRDGLFGTDEPALAAAYAEVLRGFADAVRAIR